MHNGESGYKVTKMAAKIWKAEFLELKEAGTI